MTGKNDPSYKQVISSRGRLYSSNPFRFCSSVLVGVEFVVLCAIINCLGYNQIGIPINLEHDGCLCLIDVSQGPFDIDKFNADFSKILYETTSISNMKLEIKMLDFL